MRFYYVSGSEVPYTRTLADAKDIARHIAANSYHDVTVHCVDVATDAENVLRLLNASGGHHVDRGVVYAVKAKRKTATHGIGG